MPSPGGKFPAPRHINPKHEPHDTATTPLPDLAPQTPFWNLGKRFFERGQALFVTAENSFGIFAKSGINK